MDYVDDYRGHDAQEDKPAGRCTKCKGEIYAGEEIFDLNHWLCGKYEKWVCKDCYADYMNRLSPREWADATNTPMKIYMGMNM